MNNEHFEELAALHVVGLIDDDSRVELFRAMDRDPEIDRLVRAFDEAAALLALDASPVKPPPELKREIIRQLPSRGAKSKIVHFAIWVPYAIAVCLMLVAIQQARQVLALKSQIGVENAELTRLNQSNALMGLRLTTLEPKDPAYQTSKILIAWDPNENRGVISMINLPVAAADRNYQLWVLDPQESGPISAGLLRPEAGSRSFTVKPLTTVSPGFAITLEPAGGSPEPTSSILFAVAPGQ